MRTCKDHAVIVMSAPTQARSHGCPWPTGAHGHIAAFREPVTMQDQLAPPERNPADRLRHTSKTWARTPHLTAIRQNRGEDFDALALQPEKAAAALRRRKPWRPRANCS